MTKSMSLFFFFKTLYMGFKFAAVKKFAIKKNFFFQVNHVGTLIVSKNVCVIGTVQMTTLSFLHIWFNLKNGQRYSKLCYNWCYNFKFLPYFGLLIC